MAPEERVHLGNAFDREHNSDMNALIHWLALSYGADISPWDYRACIKTPFGRDLRVKIKNKVILGMYGKRRTGNMLLRVRGWRLLWFDFLVT